MKKNQNGFSIVELIIVIVVLGVLGLIAWRLISHNSQSNSENKSANNSQSQGSQNTDEQPERFIWQQTANGWQPSETPPKCADQPMMKAPTDLSKVTSVLYPGQTRGLYKPHGGFRFDNNTDNKVTVTAPMSGYIVKATRNFAQGTTEIQYGFDIMNNCGIMVRFGHLRELPADMQKIVEKLPPASADSRIEFVNPPVYVTQGTVLATKVGLISEKNTMFDWGVYDYRQENEASKSNAFQVAHPQKETAWHGVCWLQGWLPVNDEKTLAALAVKSDTTSDYCK